MTPFHFKPGEFDHYDQIDPAAVWLLDGMRTHFGEPFTVTSSARDPQRNAAVGGSATSLHLFDPTKGKKCSALDWSIVYGQKPECYERIDRMVSAWRAYRDRPELGGRGTELEIVYSLKDKHFHIGIFPDKRPHRLIVKAD